MISHIRHLSFSALRSSASASASGSYSSASHLGPISALPFKLEPHHAIEEIEKFIHGVRPQEEHAEPNDQTSTKLSLDTSPKLSLDTSPKLSLDISAKYLPIWWLDAALTCQTLYTTPFDHRFHLDAALIAEKVFWPATTVPKLSSLCLRSIETYYSHQLDGIQDNPEIEVLPFQVNPLPILHQIDKPSPLADLRISNMAKGLNTVISNIRPVLKAAYPLYRPIYVTNVPWADMEPLASALHQIDKSQDGMLVVDGFSGDVYVENGVIYPPNTSWFPAVDKFNARVSGGILSAETQEERSSGNRKFLTGTFDIEHEEPALSILAEFNAFVEGYDVTKPILPTARPIDWTSPHIQSYLLTARSNACYMDTFLKFRRALSTKQWFQKEDELARMSGNEVSLDYARWKEAVKMAITEAENDMSELKKKLDDETPAWLKADDSSSRTFPDKHKNKNASSPKKKESSSKRTTKKTRPISRISDPDGHYKHLCLETLSEIPDDATVQNAWREQLFIWHPDKEQDPDFKEAAKKKTQALNNAYTVLKTGESC
ncbi:hypothetical protein BC938DRAFT_475945 [Jimgerdemannia flammicorona]|uniref:J domain-containing protein n=1 Tax=Jimgerdemannia flammicorona TaxID=994334 RepID=A0A433PM12_9FUNG|nr:hypothetical protein BC938DRAFT_475945 [Jimgerdemannia flammicorona]